ncbi:MAG: DEAD/DEAH box helicase [Bacteroidota bacterium]
MTSFADLGLHADIIRALDENKITEPTEIQQKVIPHLLHNRQDLLGLAQTGTGKTAAFGLPLLQHIQSMQRRGIQALVLSPTRELGQQIAQQLVLFSKYLPRISVRAVYGGTPIHPQIRSLARPPHVVVATPGRLIDLVERRAVDLSQVTYLVLDEADEMLNMGFQPAIKQIFSFLPHKKSTWLFSATMPPGIRQLTHQYMGKDHVQVKASSKNIVNENIVHQYMVSSSEHKQRVLCGILRESKRQQSIIFCKTKAATQKLMQRLLEHGIRADALHGDLSQRKRDKVMQRFRRKQIQALVATDIAARGLDVEDLHYVIHYNLPDQAEYYTHRSGRTARAGKQGISLCLVAPHEVRHVHKIAKELSLQFKRVKVPSQAYKDEMHTVTDPSASRSRRGSPLGRKRLGT